MLGQLSGAVKEISAILSVLNARDRAYFLWAIACNASSIISTQSLRPAEFGFMKDRDLLKIRAFGRESILMRPDLGLVRELYGRRVYFPEPSFLPKSGDKVIDLGANTGLFSLLCAGLGAEVLAVEAQSGFMPLVQNNLAINGVQHRVKFVSALVGASRGVFASVAARIGASHWTDEPPTLSMDALLDMFSTPSSAGMGNLKPDIHLLKMDIEGSEFGLLEGDLTWLRRISHISMEVHPEFGDVLYLKESVQREGFTCKLVSSWREVGIPCKYPGYLFAKRISTYSGL